MYYKYFSASFSFVPAGQHDIYPTYCPAHLVSCYKTAWSFVVESLCGPNVSDAGEETLFFCSQKEASV